MNKNLCLALSGGGVRAMAFHAGLLKYLAEKNAFEQVKRISSVSGGSLLVGLIYKENDYRWPDSSHYQNVIYPQIKRHLTRSNLQANALRHLLFKPKNWQYCLSRANVVAQSIEHSWGISGSVSQIPAKPEWSINGTTAENGKRFRFKHDNCGDYSLGYAAAEGFALSHALAMSAAFPGGIGPLVLHSNQFDWQKRPKWNSPSGSERSVKLPFAKLHIYDGGVYDNLGCEPFFDSGKGKPKRQGEHIFVSDAGSPLGTDKHPGPLSPFRLTRIVDITTEQCRALRVRSLMSFLTNPENSPHNDHSGYVMIGQTAAEVLSPDNYQSEDWLSKEQVKYAAAYPTHLKKMGESDFDCIARHGYESARAIDLERQCFT
ncbi:MAG: NTE family protein [Phenylobacterium sp.]|jgi:NTE family protein